jgi:glutaredoxin 3
MNAKRQVEVFSAGCPACQAAIDLVNRLACPACEVTVLDMNNINVAKRAQALGVRAVPAVVIDGRLAPCCTGAGVEEQALRAAGLGQP